MELSEKQWSRLEPVILHSARKKDSHDRKCRNPREVLNGILWVLSTGAPWRDLSDRYPPCQTCRRRFQQWVKAGVFRRIIEELAEAALEAFSSRKCQRNLLATKRMTGYLTTTMNLSHY